MTTALPGRRPLVALLLLPFAFLLTVLAAGLIAVAPGAVSAPAAASGGGAAEVYRYWAYFHVEDDAYVAAQEGLAGFTPEDGSVEALRYAAPADFESPNEPRADLDEVTFEEVCADTQAAGGEKRVAVVLDYGVEADADGATVPDPIAACAAVPSDANALQAVQSVAEVRTESSSFGPQLCAVEGYPATGCSATVDTASPADSGPVDFAIAGQETSEESAAPEESEADGAGDSAEDGSNVVLYALLGVVALALLGGGIVLARRNG